MKRIINTYLVVKIMTRKDFLAFVQCHGKERGLFIASSPQKMLRHIGNILDGGCIFWFYRNCVYLWGVHICIYVWCVCI